MQIKIKHYINKILSFFGYRISKMKENNDLIKLYTYKNYDEYKNSQIFYNKKKLNHIYADEATLSKIINFIKKNINKNNIKGICHGSRNGFEQEYFNKNLSNINVIGTDISETAKDFKNSFVWDFHDTNENWISNFDFVYSNSLDQSFDPKKAVKCWLDQLVKNGYIFIELSDECHGTSAVSKMDPFGVDLNYFPFLVSDWLGHKVSIKIINTIKPNQSNAKAIVFVLKKLD